jgi:uncharacterized iron-regulated membrane protein
MPETVKKIVNKWSRKLHRWGAIITIAPVAVVIATGLILQLKKQSDWIQPPSARGVASLGGGERALDLDGILESARGVENAGIETWSDVDRLDVRPDKGIVKVRANSRWEVQVDLHSGEVLQTMYRRSDLIESIHDGSFFGGDFAKLYVFLPSGVILFALWLTGAYLWVLPIWNKRAGRKRRAQQATGP